MAARMFCLFSYTKIINFKVMKRHLISTKMVFNNSKWQNNPSYAGNPFMGSNESVITSCFCIHNEPCDLWPLTLWPQKSNHFIGSARYIHDPSVAAIHQSVLEITRQQAIFAYIMSPVTFDLVTPKSNQFVGSARYIHDLSLAGIHESVLEIRRSRERDVRTDNTKT